jgi:ABC-type multidrug transport system ATPase subunit
MNGSEVVIRQIGKSFGTHRVIDNVSFDIKQGEFFSLPGPSGCGKTTLPLHVYSMIRFGVSPVINALSVVIIAGTVFLTLSSKPAKPERSVMPVFLLRLGTLKASL